jgi:integrase
VAVVRPHKLPSGKWRVWIKVGGQTRTVTANTRAEAMYEASQVRLSLADTTARAGGTITVLELLTHHLAARAPDLSPSTLAEYMRVVEHLDDTMADRRINRLRSPDLTAYYNACLRNGWSVGSVRRLHELMHAAWKQTAIYRGWAVINPASSARPPKRAPHTITPPDRDTLRVLFDAADDQFRLYLRLSANTGARRGELVALRWSDIDLATGELGIFRSVVYTPESGVVERPTKTGQRGQRRITVAASILPLLHAHRGDQLGRLNGAEPVYIFSDTAGIDHWFPDTPTLLFGRLRRKTGVTGVRLHDLRHFTATQMLASGLTPVQVAGRLGHADPATTLRVYSHWIPATDRQAADDLDRGL